MTLKAGGMSWRVETHATKKSVDLSNDKCPCKPRGMVCVALRKINSTDSIEGMLIRWEAQVWKGFQFGDVRTAGCC